MNEDILHKYKDRQGQGEKPAHFALAFEVVAMQNLTNRMVETMEGADESS